MRAWATGNTEMVKVKCKRIIILALVGISLGHTFGGE